MGRGNYFEARALGKKTFCNVQINFFGLGHGQTEQTKWLKKGNSLLFRKLFAMTV
jgi:hypothetical protein